MRSAASPTLPDFVSISHNINNNYENNNNENKTSFPSHIIRSNEISRTFTTNEDLCTFKTLKTIPGPVVGRPRHLLQRKRTMLGPTVMVARVAKVVRRREGLSPKSLNSDEKFKP